VQLDFSKIPQEKQLQIYYQLVKREFERRQSQETKKINKWEKYLNNPAGFITEGLQEFIWSKQREICEAVLHHDRVAVKSTHAAGKSFLVGRIAGWWISVHTPGEAMVLTSAPNFPQVKNIVWKEINRVHAKGKLPGYTNQTEWWIDKEIVALGRKPDDQNATALQGYHARYLLGLIDEGCGVPIAIWNAFETLVANGGKILVIGNPDDPMTEFGKVCQPGSGWHVISIPAFCTPNFTNEDVPEDVRRLLVSPQWVESKRKKWGESNPLYISKVLAEFPDASSDSLIPLSWIRDAVNRELEPTEPNDLGVDIARRGGNETVIYWRRGPVARLYKAFSKRDLMGVTGEIVNALRETNATRVKLDDIGLGGGVTDRLNELQQEPEAPFSKDVQIIPINVGISSTTEDDPEKKIFANLKAEYSFQLRDRFENGEIDLGDDEDTIAQISAVKYDYNSRGQFVIASKKDMVEELSKLHTEGESTSPDRWDALVLAFADPINDPLRGWKKFAGL
jgi:hypothetical protein